MKSYFLSKPLVAIIAVLLVKLAIGISWSEACIGVVTVLTTDVIIIGFAWSLATVIDRKGNYGEHN